MPTTLPYTLFGNTKPFLPPTWTTTDDRIRRGASTSSLTPLPHNGALFRGHVDTSTLGGAGFASQFSPEDVAGSEGWDLSGYDGVEIVVAKRSGQGKVYTFILKDEMPEGKREDGREKAGVNWEVDFCLGNEEDIEEKNAEKEMTAIWIPWSEFKATYRGKEKKDAGELKKGSVRRVGIMMRSYFGKQKGDFKLELRSISARNTTPGDASKTANATVQETDHRPTRSAFHFCAIL